MSSALASWRGGAPRAARTANIGNIAAPGGHDPFIALTIESTRVRDPIAGPAADEVKFMCGVPAPPPAARGRVTSPKWLRPAAWTNVNARPGDFLPIPGVDNGVDSGFRKTAK